MDYQLSASDKRASIFNAEPFGISEDTGLPAVDLLSVNDEMRGFLDEYVDEGLNDSQKVRQILNAILQDGLSLEYANFKTYTAKEAFYAKKGNCLSFTNLFVALAREAGLTVQYQEIEVPPTWAAKDGSWFYNRHINALVKLPSIDQIVDFNLDSYKGEFNARRLDDRSALARYHSNMGVHWMVQGDYRQAYLHFREALMLEPEAGHTWSNLGTLYRRVGDLRHAEQAYVAAIEASNEPAAISNLARVYRDTGREELMSLYEGRARLYRRQNPYYLFQQAQQAFEIEDYEAVHKLLTRAINRQQREPEFHRLRGLAFFKQGQLENARSSFIRAIELADEESKERYSEKLDLLARIRKWPQGR